MKVEIEDLRKVTIGPNEAVFLKTKGEDTNFDFVEELGDILKCKVFLIDDWEDMKILKNPNPKFPYKGICFFCGYTRSRFKYVCCSCAWKHWYLYPLRFFC